MLVEEAGGIITDGRGEPLDFGLGRTLGENFGVVAAGKDVHAKVIAAVKLEVEDVENGDGLDGGRVACTVLWCVLALCSAPLAAAYENLTVCIGR